MMRMPVLALALLAAPELGIATASPTPGAAAVRPGATPVPAAAAAAAAAAADKPVAAPPVATLLLDDFHKMFAADRGKVRLLLLFSPT